jgi:hypothetical protein
MTVFWRFCVVFGLKPTSSTDGRCFIEDLDVFAEIVALVRASGGAATAEWREKGRGSTTVRFSEGSPELNRILELCRSCDRTPEKGEFWSQSATDRKFSVYRIREYKTKDLREARYLTISKWTEGNAMA